jgi:phage baseplate assembly protein W
MATVEGGIVPDPIRFGSDLRLLRDLENQNSRNPGNDLLTTERGDRGKVDLKTVAGADNLKQALLLRFLTPVGELTLLGHPDYGSRLFELIGELNNETNRNRAKLFVLQALQAEPRVKEIRDVKVTQNKSDRTRIDIETTLLTVDSDTLLNLVFPFFLERGIQA